MSSILPGVRSLSGAALTAVLDVIATVARWRDALPNDPDVIREAATNALAALELAKAMPTSAAAARKLDLSTMSEEEIRALNAPRLAYMKAGTRAVDRAWSAFGPDWGKVQGHRVFTKRDRKLRIFVSKDRKMKILPEIGIDPAPSFWDDVPEGLTFLHDVPCSYRPDMDRLIHEGRIWTAGKWAAIYAPGHRRSA